MTDMTTETPILRGRHKSPRQEYKVYFGLIFAVSLPGAIIACAWATLRDSDAPRKGPIARALSQARTITPQIFSA
ncbi:MAG: photosystem II assembly protein PufQ [Rhodobacteraceae bacterium HLUCCA08]|nr:MAG: photosystem II assembly protein PufQ [Rhodobacteraceae bacterium HLUCCA08]